MKYLSIDFFIIFYSGLLLLASNESPMVFFMASLIMSMIAVYNVFRYIRNPADINLYNFFATSLLLAYALSSLTTQVKIYSLKSIDVARYFSLSQHSLSIALASVAFASAVLVFLSQLFPAKIKLPDLDRRQIREGMWFIFFVTCAGIFSIATGLMQFQGVLFSDSDHLTISPFGSMVSFSIVPAGVLALFFASGNHDLGRFERWFLYALAAALWLMTFTQARRLLVYMAFLYLIFYAFDALATPLARKKILFSVVVGVVAYFGIKLFYAFRIATWESSPGVHDPFQLLAFGFEIFNNPVKYDLDYQLSENSIDRPFVLRYLSQIIEKITFDKWFSGEALYATVMFSIPSVFIGNKNFLIDEELIHPRINLPVLDEANTILTAGMVDFGWAGLILFPVLVLLVLKATLILADRSKIKWFGYFTLFGILAVILNIENSMAQYWAFVRGTLLLLLFILPFKYVANSVSLQRRITA